MVLNNILQEFWQSGIYTEEQWREYQTFFSGVDWKVITDAVNPVLSTRILLKENTKELQPNFSISSKIVRTEYLQRHNPQQTVIGMVSGCFDLLHLGHLKGFYYAKSTLTANGDGKLCALVLSDDNIRKKKGEERPILNINERLELLSAVTALDWIIPLDGPDCLPVIETIQPNFFFKSADDRKQQAVNRESELVKKLGGQVYYFPSETEITSTTEIVEKLTTHDDNRTSRQ